MSTDYGARSPQQEALVALEAARQRLGPDAPEIDATEFASDGSNPCNGWFYAAIATFKLAAATKDDDAFFALLKEGQGYVAIGQACLDTLDTLGGSTD